jgi:hypothetical protein
VIGTELRKRLSLLFSIGRYCMKSTGALVFPREIGLKEWRWTVFFDAEVEANTSGRHRLVVI